MGLQGSEVPAAAATLMKVTEKAVVGVRIQRVIIAVVVVAVTMEGARAAVVLAGKRALPRR